MNQMAKRNLGCAWLVILAASLCAGEQPLTDQECTAFAKKIEAGIMQGDAKALNDVVDLQGILMRATEGTEVSADARQSFIAGVTGSFRLGANVVQALGNGGSYKFMRVRQVAGKPLALFRMLSEQGVNYHDFTLARDAQGRIQIVDAFIFMMGEPIGQTMRRVFLQTRASQGGVVGKLLGWENDFVKNADKFKQITQATQGGQAEQAKKLYFELPESIQNDRTMLVLRTQWANKLGDAEYTAALAAVEKAFPNDPSMQFIGIDGLFMSKKYDEGIAVLDKLIQNLGPDAHLYMLKANFHMVKGDLPNALAWDRKAIALEPDLLPPYWALLTVLLQQKDFAAIKDVFLSMERSKLAVLDGVEKSENYAEFVKSPEYQQWLKERPKREPPEKANPPAEQK